MGSTFQMLKTLTITQVKQILQYKKNCSVYEWCQKNGVEVYRDNGSKRPYIISSEFEQSRYRKFIKKLQKQFPKTWRDVFKAHQSNDIISLAEFETNPISVKPISSYKVQGEIEKKLVAEWNKKNVA